MQIPSKKQIEDALYTDESGSLIGLDEVQLLDRPPLERFSILQAALESQDLEIRYRAAVVLAAWGDDQGLDAIEDMIDNRIDQKGICVPHRIHQYNNIYDEFAYAIYLFGHSGRRSSDLSRIFKKILQLYGPCRFESKLKNALLAREDRDIIPSIESACERALDSGEPYLASQLLPVLAKWEPEKAWSLVPLFTNQPSQTPNPIVNVAEALRYIHSKEARALLEEFCRNADSVVADEADKVIRDLDQN